jgi:hypothetical protein
MRLPTRSSTAGTVDPAPARPTRALRVLPPSGKARIPVTPFLPLAAGIYIGGGIVLVILIILIIFLFLR